ncbi:MAG: hypothetical protein K2W81_11935 [Sphingomonas sp.]|uniref:hypothetical protein n=1 Tax=Sphingomonas sp. TaxID=28214 RepID=UPI0025D8BA93|nr:hypothetical protein [Sphingomonas sp.]MBY0284656.1 hypothetical protein [Sphingomonas sp.]
MSFADRYNADGSRIRAVLAIFALIGFGFGWVLLYAQGSMVILDADGVVDEVVLRDSSRQVSAMQLVGGLYVTNAHLEGEALVRCRNGREINYGYYTAATHIWQTIEASDCKNARLPSTLTASASYTPNA